MAPRSRRRFGTKKPAAAGNDGPVSAETTAAPGTADDATKKKKYNAKGRFVGKQWCASEAEAVRYEQLLDMTERGLVTKLECQPRYQCTINGWKICDYIADFRFTWHGAPPPDVIWPHDPRGYEVVEEVKGMETPEWKLKCRLVRALHGIEIRVIRKLSGKDWEEHPELAKELIGRKSSFAEQIKVRYADRIA